LEELDQVDVSRLVPSLFEEVINSANPDYLQLVLETGIGCRFDKIAGQRGIRAAVMHEDDRYLRTLLGHVCKSHERLTYQTLSALIARSNRPERMLLMPAGAATQSELNKAFGAILRLKETKYIQDFVELGADVNYQVENQSALLVSIDQRQSRLATSSSRIRNSTTEYLPVAHCYGYR